MLLVKASDVVSEVFQPPFHPVVLKLKLPEADNECQ